MATGADKPNWLYLVYLLISGTLSVLFLFYFNRLFAILVSYAIRAYVWRRYQVYIKVQALQFSLLGGRCFFKGLHYHGHNETVLINDGYITWRYWLRRVGSAEALGTAANLQAGEEEGQNQKRPASNLPCRVKLKVRGLEWYIYNRTPAYDAIEKSLSAISKAESPATKLSQGSPDSERNVSASEKNDTYQKCKKEEIVYSSRVDDTGTRKETGGLASSSQSNSISEDSSDDSLPAFLMLLPIKIECGRAAIVMGNRNTRSALVAKSDAVTGQVDARRTRPADLYKQMFDFDFTHPLVELRPNRVWDQSQIPATSTAASCDDGRSSPRARQGYSYPDSDDQMQIAPANARDLVRRCKSFFHRLFRIGSNRKRPGATGSSQIPGQDHWLGLTRYLEDEDSVAVEQERWRSIEYGEHPTIVDSPKINMSLYWDVPGLVLESAPDTNRAGDEDDINGDVPPDWAVELRIHGGLVCYGPWADRLRQDLQPMFFPNVYKDAIPAERLSPGQQRTSTVFRLNVDFEATTTLMIPTRESSKDWKWKEEQSAKGKAKKEENTGRGHRRKKKREKSNAPPPGRPYGWLDIELQADSTVTFLMDMVARQSGYRNSLKLDIRGPKVSSSVNHGLLLSTRDALISCDLSNPLGWSAMRQWAVVVDANALELFLLRDHIFLLTDIMNDWTTGPAGDFHTFVPFKYGIDLRVTGFNLYLNANDSNVINSPASMEENTFVTVWATNLVASLQIPLSSFRPLRNQIPFDIDAQNGGFKFSRPPWNTQYVFVKSSEVATMQDLKIDGFYDYMASTSSELTDVLRMNVRGTSPNIHLYGFLVRAFMRIKGNYFGEDVHFRTLEEYQGRISQDSIGSSSGLIAAQPSKISNDLDVILCITAVTAKASLPSYLYSSTENVLLDIPSLGLELRFTNYYMDLDVSFSPITVGHSSSFSPTEQGPTKPSEKQVFIDGVEIKGHRLFGLPPAEPTYICNWDFDIGDITGECSVSFVRLLSSALRCFAFTFDDAENALQPLSIPEIHDVTYLRAKLKLIRVWVLTEDGTVLLTSQCCNIDYNDLAKSLFSQRLNVTFPSVAMAVMNTPNELNSGYDHSNNLRPYAFLESAFELSMLHRNYAFYKDRHLQQHHISIHDSRTNRIPWLITESETSHGLVSSYEAKLTAPAMPFPAMPQPMYLPESSTIASVSTSSDSSATAKSATKSKAGSTFRLHANRGKLSTSSKKDDLLRREPDTKSQLLEPETAPPSWVSVDVSNQHGPTSPADRLPYCGKTRGTRGSNIHRSLSTSSSYKAPYFRLQNTSLDLSEVPQLPINPASHRHSSRRSSIDVHSEEFALGPQTCERTSMLVDLGQGVRGLFKPQSLKVLMSIFEGIQMQEPESLLDRLQINTLERLPNHEKELDHQETVTEARIRLSYCLLRVLDDTQDRSPAAVTDISCDLTITECISTARRWSKITPDANSPISDELSAHIMLSHAGISMKASDRQTQQNHGVVHLGLRDSRFWGRKATDSNVHARFEDLELKLGMMGPKSLPVLLQRMNSVSEDISYTQRIVSNQASRLRQLVLSLTKDGQDLPDPPFLTRASYVLRIANSQLRASESWRIISRLRYVYHLLPARSGARIRSHCFGASPECPGSAREDVITIFGRLGMWNGDDVKESVFLDEVFRQQINEDSRPSVGLTLDISVKAESVRLLLQPGKAQSQVELETMAFDMMLRQPPSSIGEASSYEGIASTCLYFSRTMITLNFSLLGFLRDIMLAVADGSDGTKPNVGGPSREMLHTISSYRLHFLWMSEENTIALDSPSLRILYSCRPLRSSAIVAKPSEQRQLGMSFLLCTDAAAIEVLSQSQVVSIAKVDRPSLFGNLDGEKTGVTPRSWHLATSCTDVSLKVLEDPLALLAILERLLLNEVASIKQVLSSTKRASRTSLSETASPTDITLGRPHVALFLDSYLISYKILSSLSYRVTGKVGRIAVRPGSRRNSDMVLDFDLKEHAHAFLGRDSAAFQIVSELVIPPINGHVVIGTDASQKDVSLQSTVEHISLDAAAVHALLVTLSYPEIAELGSSIQEESSRLTLQHGPSVPSKDPAPNATQAAQPFLFDVSLTLVGLGIHTNTGKGAKQQLVSRLHYELGHVHLKGSNRGMSDRRSLKFPELFVYLRGMQMSFTRSSEGQERPCGEFTLGATFQATSQPNVKQELVRAYQVCSSRCETVIYTETASVVNDVLNDLRESFRDIDLANEVKGLQKLRRATLADLDAGAPSRLAKVDEAEATALFDSMYSLKLKNARITWKVGESVPLSPGRDAEDLVLSCTKIDLATRRDNAARLLIQDLQMQMVPPSQVSTDRSRNSALLPEVVFNVAYMSTRDDRRLAFQAAGKSLDLRLTSQFIIPASNLRRSIALAVNDIRAGAGTKAVSAVETETQVPTWLKHKKLTSLLIDADFAGAVVHVQGRAISEPESLALDVLHGRRVPQQGRYGQFTQADAGGKTILRAPGVAIKVEYKDFGVDNKSLNAEVKVDASSNVLYPSVVPLVLEISSSVKEIVGEQSPQAGTSTLRPSIVERMPSASKLIDDERLKNGDPSVIFGNCVLNLGLRICRQDFTLSCQPIARVAATAQIDNIYITANTVRSKDHGQSFTLSGSFSGLQASIQHAYSRDSTGGVEVQAIAISLMNSKHLGAANGISVITQISPMKIFVNAKQSQDFLLFREIWLPADIREPAPAAVPSASSEPQAYIVQRYQHIASAGAFPLDATLSIAKLDFQVDLGQSLGKSGLTLSELWVSSKKSSDWEQNLCLGIEDVSLDSTGRMSGFVAIREVEVRTTIRWPVTEKVMHQAPLIQASMGFGSIRVKAAFEYQAFAVADMGGFKFLMYNVRDSQAVDIDRLLSVVQIDRLRAFCTATSASQALALYQAFERLIQEKRTAYETSLKESEKFLRRRSLMQLPTLKNANKGVGKGIDQSTEESLRLQAKVMVSLAAMNVGVFPSTFFDTQVFRLEALDASAHFSVAPEKGRLHSVLGLALGQLQVALSGVTKQEGRKSVGEVLPEDVIGSVSHSRGGTILKVPKVVATMQTWQSPASNNIEYIFKSAFQGKVDVGWNYSRISFLRGMWNNHVRALAARLGKPLPQSALQITTALEGDGKGDVKGAAAGREKITAVVNMPQSKYQYTPLESPVIETPQLRDMGEATPPLEWIGLHRERLPNLTHQIVIVSLLEVAREVDDAYSRILGSS
ncbi:MAG: hypothetical protein Q9170_003641 [Blastenia crenularia]